MKFACVHFPFYLRPKSLERARGRRRWGRSWEAGSGRWPTFCWDVRHRFEHKLEHRFANVLLCTAGWDQVGLSCCWFPVFCLLSHTIVTTVASFLKFSIDSLATKSQIGNVSKLMRLPRLKHSQLPPLSLSLAPTFHQIRFRFFAGKHFVSVGQTLVTFVNVSRQTNNETLSIL